MFLFFVGTFIVGMAVIGSYELGRSIYLCRTGMFVMGKIINIRPTRGWPEYLVRYAIDKEVYLEKTFGTSFPFKTGDDFPVLYIPKNPKNAIAYLPDSMWGLPVVFIGVAAFLAYWFFRTLFFS